MKLDFFMLADHAVAAEAPDGSRKLNVSGGGVTHVRASAFPYKLASISVVVRFFLEDEDRTSNHTLGIRVLQPGGDQLVAVGQQMEISDVAPTAHPGEEPSLFVVGTFENLPLAEKGRYVFELTLDDAVIDSKAIAAIAVPDDEGTSTEG